MPGRRGYCWGVGDSLSIVFNYICNTEIENYQAVKRSHLSIWGVQERTNLSYIPIHPSPLKSPEATRLVRGEVVDSTRRGDEGGEVIDNGIIRYICISGYFMLYSRVV